MIDFTKYNRYQMQAIVEVLDALIDDLITNDITESLSIPMREYRRAVVAEREAEMLEAEQAGEAHCCKVQSSSLYGKCVAGTSLDEEPDDLRTVVDTLSRCSDRLAALAALALAEDKRFDECGQMDTFIKLTTLRNANRSIIDTLSRCSDRLAALADIRDHFKEVLSDD